MEAGKAERERLAAQVVCLADTMSRTTEAAAAATAGQAQVPAPSPDQLKQIAGLMQRLTQESAALMEQRDGLEGERTALHRSVFCVCGGGGVEGSAGQGRAG